MEECYIPVVGSILWQYSCGFSDKVLPLVLLEMHISHKSYDG